MLTFTIWLLISTSPIGDVSIDGHFDSLLQCLQVAEPEQVCISGDLLRLEEEL